MGHEALDEVIIAAGRGTLFIRGGYGREEVWLGLASGRRPEGDPDIMVELTPLMRQRLVEALTKMPAPPTTDCWFCGERLSFPADSAGRLHVDADVTCRACGGLSRTTEDDDDEAGPVIAMAPVRCGHGIDHDEHCSKCATPEIIDQSEGEK